MSTSNRSCTAPHTFAQPYGSNHMRVSSRAVLCIQQLPRTGIKVIINMSRVTFEELCVQQGWTLRHENSCVGLWGTKSNCVARYNYSFRTATFYSR